MWAGTDCACGCVPNAAPGITTPPLTPGPGDPGGDPWAGGSWNLWLASPGAVTPLHYDTAANVYVQLRGRKHFLLAEPCHAFDAL